MKLTVANCRQTLEKFNMFSDDDISLAEAILRDALEYSVEGIFPDKLEIYIVDVHTQYSAERTDPCPDYYGTFAIKWASSDDTINDGFTLNCLDDNMCTLCQAFSQIKNHVKFEKIQPVCQF